MAGGLHGWAGPTSSVRITELGRCRFRLSKSDRTEDIDFAQIEEIRVSIVADPASGLAALVARRDGAKQDVASVILVLLIGRNTAVCSSGECQDRQSFAIRDVERIETVRRAARDLRDGICPTAAAADRD